MDFTWWTLFSKWAKEAGLSPLTTFLTAIGIALVIYLAKIAKGIRGGYGVILQDQKDATAALRELVKTEREDCRVAQKELEECRNEQEKLLRALALAKQIIAANGLTVPPQVIAPLSVRDTCERPALPPPAEGAPA